MVKFYLQELLMLVKTKRVIFINQTSKKFSLNLRKYESNTFRKYKRIGMIGEIIDVKKGYARNF